jgi:hypothetical protein
LDRRLGGRRIMWAGNIVRMRAENAYEVIWENLKGEDHLEDFCMDLG